MRARFCFILFITGVFQWAHAGSIGKEDMKVYCSADLNALAQEAVEYHMTGAPSSDLPNNCAKKRKWKYFDPNIEERNEPPKILPQYTFFEPGRDSFKVAHIRKVGDRYEIDVDFVINKKRISTKYLYNHNLRMQKYSKVCGVVQHPNPPWIYRSDCKK